MSQTIFIVSIGSGDDGDAYRELAYFTTREKAEAYKQGYEAVRYRQDGSRYCLTAEIDEVRLDPAWVPHPDETPVSIRRGVW